MKKIKCKECENYFEKPEAHNLITAFWVKFCSLKCRRSFTLDKQRKEKEKNLTRQKKEKLETKKKERREKVKTKRANSPSVLIKKADILFSKFIRLRDSYKTTWTPDRCKCITCSKEYETKLIHNWHFASRRFYQTRWLDKNCNAQCYMCNVGMWWEQYKHWQEIDKMYWEWTAEQIMSYAREVTPLNTEELKQIIENIKIKLSEFD